MIVIIEITECEWALQKIDDASHEIAGEKKCHICEEDLKCSKFYSLFSVRL